MKPVDLGLPFKDWRRYQFETILEIVASDKKIKLVGAPTGSGKSGIAMGVAKMTGAKKSVIACTTIQLQEQYCPTPETKILTADLRWVRADSVKAGDKLMGFDEERAPHRRMWRGAIVEAVEIIERPCVELTLEDGTTLTCSAEHQWLTNRGNARAEWLASDRLRVGGRFASKLARVLPTWETKADWSAGYLAAAFDGEGCLVQGEAVGNGYTTTLTFSQKDNAMYRQVQELLATDYPRATVGGNRADVRQIQIGYRADMLRFLGSVRPQRLLDKFNPDRMGQINPTESLAVVERVWVGVRPVVAIKTSTGTYVADGFMAHNCNDFPELRTVRGRSNFPCLINDVTADDAVCTVSGPYKCAAHAAEQCGYYNQLYAGLNAPVAVLNYAYWLRVANSSGRFGEHTPDGEVIPRRLDILFGDEAHELDGQLKGVVESRLPAQSLARYGIDVPEIKPDDPLFQDIEFWREWADNAVQILPPLSASGLFYGMPTEDVRAYRRLQAVHNAVESVRTIEDEWMVRAELNGTIVFQPVWTAKYAKDYVFRHADSVVLMSATFLGAEHACRDLGLNEDEVDYFEVPSTFPVANRMVYLRPTVKVSRKMSRGDIDRLIAGIDRIIDKHPSEKGLVHTTNYELANTLIRQTRHRNRVITHASGRDRIETLARFKKSDRPLVLASPSMTTGVDLPEDQCRFVVVLKLPFPNLGDENVKRRMKIGPDGLPNERGSAWYQWHTACQFVQSLGRGVRSPTDKCLIYVLDANVKWFMRAVKPILPEWVREALVWDEDLTDLAKMAQDDELLWNSEENE